MQSYTLFLDESGQVEYPKFDPQKPILTVGGVAIADDVCSEVYDEIRGFKLQKLGDENIPLRYSDIIQAKREFYSLRDPIRLNTFISDLYEKKLSQLDWIVLREW